MWLMRSVVDGLRSLIRSGERASDLDREVESYLEISAREKMRTGMSRADAMRAARTEIGSADAVKKDVRAWGWESRVETVWQDLRYGARGLRRSPTFFFTITATIAIGLGVVTALFTVFDANYLRPLPIRNAQSLYEISWMDRSGAVQNFSWHEFQEFLTQNAAFSEALAEQRAEARLNGRAFSGVLVSGNYFSMLGAGTAAGRTLMASDTSAPGAASVLVLSYKAWQSRFAEDPNVVGQKIILRGRTFEIVGVASEEFSGLGGRPADFWAPITMAPAFDPAVDLFGALQPRTLQIVGSLRPEFSVREAETSVGLWARRFSAELPFARQAMAGIATSRATRLPFNPKNAGLFSIVLAIFALILAIACANVANMMLARAVGRQREIAVRLSLGASPGRLVRQLLTESLLLVLPAAALGMAFSQALLRASVRVLTATLPPGISGFSERIPNLSPDLRVFAFSGVAALLATLGCGLAPALRAARSDLSEASRGTIGGNWRPSLVRQVLLVGQVTVCTLLLVSTGVLLSGIRELQGFDASLSGRDVIEVVPREASRLAVLSGVSAEPSLAMVAAATSAPVDRKPFVLVRAASGALMPMAANAVSPEYFRLFDLPFLRGRNFTQEEARAAAPVVVLSQTAASRLWPNRAPASSIELASDGASGAAFRIPASAIVAGIVGDEDSRWVAGGDSKALIYFPSAMTAANTKLFVSAETNVGDLMRRMDSRFAALGANAIDDIRALQIRTWVWEETYSYRLMYWLSGALGGFALLLTLSGIYGVVSYVVSQRTEEIGVRMALGASAESVVRLVLWDAMRLSLVGECIACAGALGLGKVLAASLGAMNILNPLAYAGGLIFVGIACAAAAYRPARRAAKVDPLVALRHG